MGGYNDVPHPRWGPLKQQYSSPNIRLYMYGIVVDWETQQTIHSMQCRMKKKKKEKRKAMIVKCDFIHFLLTLSD